MCGSLNAIPIHVWNFLVLYLVGSFQKWFKIHSGSVWILFLYHLYHSLQKARSITKISTKPIHFNWFMTKEMIKISQSKYKITIYLKIKIFKKMMTLLMTMEKSWMIDFLFFLFLSFYFSSLIILTKSIV